ncbi:MAG: hypothetical protein B7733_02215 [Myxococcales bacterium FL481]|nr:MAG: hypothetical protein B7733_02215 [Myxococcales bacterium FL481]
MSAWADWWRRLFVVERDSGRRPRSQRPVSLRGVVQPLESLRSPVSGEECVSIRLTAMAPAAFGTLLGGVTRHDTACWELAEFLLQGAEGTILVRASRPASVERFHAELVARHGVDLEWHEVLIRSGDEVLVTGRVVEHHDGAPHRRQPYRLVVAATAVDTAR